MNNSKQIKLGALLSYVSIAFNIVAGLVYTPWMVSQIGKSQYGLYTLANSLITLFLIDFGLGAATSRFMSKYKAEGKPEKAENFLGAVYKLYLALDLVILVLLTAVYFCVDIIYTKLTPAELEQFKVVYCIAGLYAVINFPFVNLNGILTAHEKFIQLKTADIIHRVLTVALTVAALLMGYGLYALVTANALSGIAVILFKLVVINKCTDAKVNFKNTDKKVYPKIFAFSLWSTVASLAARLVFNITPSILGAVVGTGAIAVFGIVTTIEGYTYTITSAINGMFMPRISRIYADDPYGKSLMPLMIKVGKFQYVLNGLIVSAFAVIGKDFILLWMGEDYVEAYLGILLVILPGLIYNSLQIGTTAMVVRNKVKEQAIIVLAVGVLNVILSFLLSSWIGFTGACISIFVVYTLRALLYAAVQQKALGIDIPQFAKKCILRMSPPIVITVALGFALNLVMSSDTWLGIIIKGVIICIIYGGSVIVMGLDQSEKQKLKSTLGRFLKR